MLNRTAVVGVMVLAMGAWFLRSSAGGQEAPRPGAEMRFKTIADFLERPVDVKEFLNPMTLKEFLTVLSGKLVDQGQEVAIMVDWRSFNAQNPDQYPDPEALYALQIKPVIRDEQRHLKFKPSVLLRYALRQIPTNDATYLIRRGQVEIVTFDVTDPAYLLGLRVTAHFNKRPLDEALEELSHQTGATIVLDTRLGDKTKTPVTATFKGTVSLEAAVRLLAEMADLETDLEDTTLFVTGKPKLEPAPQKSDLHLKNRWLDLALRDLSRWSGATIVLDPNVKIRRTAGEAPRARMEAARELEVALVAGDPLKRFRREVGDPEEPSFKVTATFKANVPVESAVRILANQARLSVVVLEGAFFVTTPANAEMLRNESRPKKT
jgi:hypothetical protein